MRLTKHTDFSLRVLIYLSLQPTGKLVNNADIAQHFEIPKNHLIKVVHKLSRLNYIHTKRGRSGGIMLDPLSNGFVISTGIVIIIYNYASKSRWLNKHFSFTYLIILLLALISTQSRSSILFITRPPVARANLSISLCLTLRTANTPDLAK